MVVDMETSPSYFDPEDLNSREPYRRYRERRSGSSISPLPGNSALKVFYDGQRIQIRPNTALFLEEIKQEFENAEMDAGMVSNKRSSIDDDDGFDSNRRDVGNPVLKSCKVEDEVAVDGVESTFALFASLLDSAIQGLMPISDLILRFESACRNVSESIRFGLNGRHRVFEDKLMKQKAGCCWMRQLHGPFCGTFWGKEITLYP
ncbi:hypothetical protein GIB67_032859 [Kingdonia uniflora]|uniref:Uncharacterized protein n=1 Tax=Kingdonia uniflora TaxID=39325 RepID=A0A7J7NBL0_9MAGN|nr:hypothetical protein GIB67_032859 [Kingdonia uniflora]